MINQPIITDFLRHVYSQSIPNVANIMVAEAENDYDTIIQYLIDLRQTIDDWIDKLETEKESKMKDE